MRRVRCKPLLLSFVPGLGHIHFRRYLAGVALFVVFAVSLNGLLLVALWRGEIGGVWAWVSAAGAIGAWVASVSWVLRRAVLVDPRAIDERRQAVCREGLVHYLRGEYARAIECWRTADGLGPEAGSPELLLMMAAAYRELGDRRRARRLLRRSAAWDTEGSWAFERSQQWALLEGGDAIARGRAEGQRSIRLPLQSWAATEGTESGAVMRP